MLGRKMIYARCINCSYNNVAKGIRLLNKKAIFVYTGIISYSKSFYKRNSLKVTHNSSYAIILLDGADLIQSWVKRGPCNSTSDS